MPRKISQSQTIAFFRALRRTGNVTLAAAVAGVSKSGIYARCKRDARFAGLCARVVARAREALRAEARTSPPLPHPSPLKERGDLVVRRGVRARVGEWTAETERRFLGAIAATKDLAIAVTSAGTSSSAA